MLFVKAVQRGKPSLEKLPPLRLCTCTTVQHSIQNATRSEPITPKTRNPWHHLKPEGFDELNIHSIVSYINYKGVVGQPFAVFDLPQIGQLADPLIRADDELDARDEDLIGMAIRRAATELHPIRRTLNQELLIDNHRRRGFIQKDYLVMPRHTSQIWLGALSTIHIEHLVLVPSDVERPNSFASLRRTCDHQKLVATPQLKKLALELLQGRKLNELTHVRFQGGLDNVSFTLKELTLLLLTYSREILQVARQVYDAFQILLVNIFVSDSAVFPPNVQIK
jgi:hypothetical protein